jgi:hypothetical protein
VLSISRLYSVKWMDDKRTEKDLQGSDHGLIQVLLWHLFSRTGRPWRTSVTIVLCLRTEPSTPKYNSRGILLWQPAQCLYWNYSLHHIQWIPLKTILFKMVSCLKIKINWALKRIP